MKVGVLGAGAIGCYLGGRLAAGGHDVVLVGRARVLDPIGERGVALEDLDGSSTFARPRTSEDPGALRDRDVVLVTTKTAALASAVAQVRDHESIVIGLQNGVDHPRVLREALGRPRARAGTVAWNVVWRDARTLRRSTTGPLIVEKVGSDPIVVALIAALVRAGLDASTTDDVEPVLWTKLLFNLNNAIQALSGLPLAEELGDRRWRRVVAASQREGLAAMRAAGIQPVRLGRLEPRVSARLLDVPDALFRVLARAMIRIDPAARSSMAGDLEAGRATEAPSLQGAIVRLGERHGIPTPVCRRVLEAIRAREAGETAPIAPEALLGRP